MVLGGVGFVFAAYSAYFHKLGYDWTHLLNGYRPSGIAKLSTGLTENMLNIWYPVANHYARRGFPLYTVDRPAVAYNIATVLVAVAFVGSAFAVAYGARRRALAISVLLVAALWTLALPMLGAHAHENHLFHGLLLTLPIVAIARERALTIACIVLLTADGINVAVRYAFGLNHLTHWPVVGNISGFYNATRLPPLVTAYVAIAAWLIVMGLVLRIAVGRPAIAPVPESPQLSEPAASRAAPASRASQRLAVMSSRTRSSRAACVERRRCPRELASAIAHCGGLNRMVREPAQRGRKGTGVLRRDHESSAGAFQEPRGLACCRQHDRLAGGHEVDHLRRDEVRERAMARERDEQSVARRK